MRKLLPRFDWGRWGGGASDGHYCIGFAVAIEWLGLIVEIGIGQVRP